MSVSRNCLLNSQFHEFPRFTGIFLPLTPEPRFAHRVIVKGAAQGASILQLNVSYRSSLSGSPFIGQLFPGKLELSGLFTCGALPLLESLSDM